MSARAGLRVLLVGLATLAAALVFAPAGPAAAHATLLSVDPADGSTLAAPPQEIRLTFSEDILEGTPQMRMTGPDGVVETTLQTGGAVVSAPLPPGLGAGEYTVLWRVTSADGHPISGRTSFVIAGAGAGGQAAGSAQPSPSAAVTDPLDIGSGTTASVFLMVGALVAAAAGIGLVVAKTRRRPQA